MIHLFCEDNLYKINIKYINYLLDNINFIKLVIILDEDMLYRYIIDNKLIYSNNILISNINENLLKRVSTINLNNNFYILNLTNISNNDIKYLSNYNVQILSQYYINYHKFIYLPYLLDKSNKIYNIGVINDDKGLITKFNINILTLENLFDKSIFNYKIIININNENDFLLNNKIYEYCVYNKIIIINSKKINQYSNLDKYVINIEYNIIPLFMLFILKNYNIIHDVLFNDLNIINDVFNNIKKKDNFGFIIIRHVNNEKTNNYWINSYKCIRRLYDNKIVIIDDNSDYSFIKYNIEELNIINCEFIQSEYPKRGEILGYYYFYKYHYFEKAVIIHDSVFINKYIDFDIYDNIKFLWHFKNIYFDKKSEKNLLNNLDNINDIIKLYDNINQTNGCFGVQSVITYNFLNIIVNKYKLFNLLNNIYNRDERMNFERIFALLCINECNELIINPSILGDIHNYIRFGYTYDDYLLDKLENLEIIKVWTGR